MHKLITAILVSLAFFSIQVWAGRSGSSNSGGFSFVRSESTQELVLSATQGKISFAGGNSLMTVNGMYGYFFMPQVEGALELTFLNSSGGGTQMTLFFDGIYNFQADYINSFFAFGGFGINSYSGRNSSSSTSSMKFGGGKRLQMWGQVSLMPMIWMQKDGSADMTTNIMPLNFSLLF
jgi:hypothetical protein